MMKKILNFIVLILGFSFCNAQEDIIISHSRFMQKVNPSAYGMNNINKTGVLYNSASLVYNNSIAVSYTHLTLPTKRIV